MKVYLRDSHRLAWFERRADGDFWSRHWRLEDLRQHVRSQRSDAVFTPAVRRYLPRGSRLLEGGCGRGEKVHALRENAYEVVGVDFAGPVVRAVNAALPELTILAADVRDLPFRSGAFDGYVSGGVIEHFWDGYEPILGEMARVLRRGGYLFLTFPQMSPLRRWKARRGDYGEDFSERDVDRFYQFALDAKAVAADLGRRGFTLIERRGWDGIKGFKDEVRLGRRWLQEVYDRKRLRRQRPWIDAALRPFAPHMAFLILRKDG